ncbi:MAG: hypothetical protein HY257_01465 [Chloroflexi bacterium]|nr:hypothetical protein [Chloroflexota bacterium]
MASPYLWRGTDKEGVECFIAREQWNAHVVKRPEITDAFDLTVRAMQSPDRVELDPNREDEASRYFRLLVISAEELRVGYELRVSVKYVLQNNGAWFMFFQSCWFERAR